MGLSRTVSEINGDFSRKLKVFPTPCISCPRWRGSPWNWVSALGSKTRIMWLPGRERSLTISSAIWIQSTNGSDGRTDRHQATAKTPRLRIASRVKNRSGGGYKAEKKSWMISLSVSIQYRRVTTDGHRATAKTALALRRAGKKTEMKVQLGMWSPSWTQRTSNWLPLQPLKLFMPPLLG